MCDNKKFCICEHFGNLNRMIHDAGLDGFANSYKLQAQEEREHAMLLKVFMVSVATANMYLTVSVTRFPPSLHL